jgi:hypothetical protein
MPRHTRWGQTKGPCGQLLNGTGGRRVARARGEGFFFVAGDACRAPATTPSTRAPGWVPSRPVSSALSGYCDEGGPGHRHT